jgi:AraC family cel operon transcriptional repressor
MTSDFEIINILIPAQTMLVLFDFLGENFKPDRLLKPKVPPDTRLSLDDLETVVTSLEKLVVAKHAYGVSSESLFRFTLLNLIFLYFPVKEEHGMPDMPTWLRGLCLEMMKKRNFTEGLTALYNLANKSKEHLARIFRRYLKKTPTEFVNDLRLEYSARMIASTKAKIVDICGDAGFESVSHYNHLFHTKYGMSPLEFRSWAANTVPEYSLVGDSILETGIPQGIPFLSNDSSVTDDW